MSADMRNFVFGNSLVNDEVSAVEVKVCLGEADYVGKGYAKKHPKDEPDYETGLLLAYSRALLDLAEQLAAEAERRIYPIRATINDINRHQELAGELAERWISDDRIAEAFTNYPFVPEAPFPKEA